MVSAGYGCTPATSVDESLAKPADPQKEALAKPTDPSQSLVRSSKGGKGKRGVGRSSTFLSFFDPRGSFEPKNVNFLELCQTRYPGKQWADLHIKEQTSLIADALRAEHFLFDPHSNAMKRWDFVVIFALTFTGLITPYEVIFMEKVAMGLFIFNRIIDCIFLIDMLLQLFLKVEIKREGNYGTVVLRDPKLLRWKYLTGWFCVDLVSILPFDLLILLMGDKSEILQRAKILRCIRLLRLMKLTRILSSSRIIQRWQNYLSINFAKQKLMMSFVMLLLASHWMACIWGAVGLFFGKELCKDGVLTEEQVPTEEVSWITTLFMDSKRSPDTPCSNFHVYLASLHWSVMTITSIGYGDICPVRDAEYIVCILCMLIGGVIWAYIIGCTCSILSNVDPVEENFESSTDLLNRIMTEVAMPSQRQHRYRKFLREAKVHDAKCMFRDVTNRFSPLLRQELMLHISESSIRNIFYFRDAPRELIMELSERLTTKFFAFREPVTGITNCLCMIERGSVAHRGIVMVPGNVFQEDVIITNTDLHVVMPSVSLTYTLLFVLSRSDMDEALRCFPPWQSRIRKQAAKMALGRTVRLCREIALQLNAGASRHMTLTEAFSLLCNHQQGSQTRWRLSTGLSAVFNQSNNRDTFSNLLKFPVDQQQPILNDKDSEAHASSITQDQRPREIPQKLLANQAPLPHPSSKTPLLYPPSDTSAVHQHLEWKLELMAKELQSLSGVLRSLQGTSSV